MCIFFKGRVKVRKWLTSCSEDSASHSLHALQCRCGHGCWLDYTKNVMQFSRTGRGLAKMERRFWPGGGVETRAVFFKRAKPEMNWQKQKELKSHLKAFLSHLSKQLAEKHLAQNWLVRSPLGSSCHKASSWTFLLKQRTTILRTDEKIYL